MDAESVDRPDIEINMYHVHSLAPDPCDRKAAVHGVKKGVGHAPKDTVCNVAHPLAPHLKGNHIFVHHFAKADEKGRALHSNLDAKYKWRAAPIRKPTDTNFKKRTKVTTGGHPAPSREVVPVNVDITYTDPPKERNH